MLKLFKSIKRLEELEKRVDKLAQLLEENARLSIEASKEFHKKQAELESKLLEYYESRNIE